MAAGRAYMNAMADDDVVLGPEDPALDNSDAESSEAQEEQQVKKKEEAKAPKRPRATAPKPALTMAILQDEHKGFNHLFQTFPDVLRQGFKGKGHEVADLQRLLEMYSRWHQRIFPYCGFDEFIHKVESYSGSKLVKEAMKDLRQQLITLLDDPVEEEEQEEAGEDAAQLQDQRQTTGTQALPGAAAGQAAPGPSGSGAAARQPVGTAAHALPAAAPAVLGAEEDDMAELLEMDMEADMQWEAAMDVMDEWDDAQPAATLPRPAPAPAPAASGQLQAAAPGPATVAAAAPGGPALGAAPEACDDGAELDLNTQQLRDEQLADEMDEELMRQLQADNLVDATATAPDAMAPAIQPSSGQPDRLVEQGAQVGTSVMGPYAEVLGLEDEVEDGVGVGVGVGEGSEGVMASQVVRRRVRAALLDDDDDE